MAITSEARVFRRCTDCSEETTMICGCGCLAIIIVHTLVICGCCNPSILVVFPSHVDVPIHVLVSSNANWSLIGPNNSNSTVLFVFFFNIHPIDLIVNIPSSIRKRHILQGERAFPAHVILDALPLFSP